MVSLNGDTTKRPTHGLHEILYRNWRITEFGGNINWRVHLKRRKPPNAICIVLHPKFREEEHWLSNNLLWELHECTDPSIPFVLIVGMPCCARHPHNFPKGRTITFCYLNYEAEEWRYRIDTLLTSLT